MEGLNLEYRKVVVEALSGSHTAARHTQFLHQDAFDPQSIDIQQLHFCVNRFHNILHIVVAGHTT